MAEGDLLQWVKFGLEVPEVYLNGPELAAYLDEAGHDEAAEIVREHVLAIELGPEPGRVNGLEGPS